MAERPCLHRWMASRVEVETLPVEHVCCEPHTEHAYGVRDGHPVPVHRCACGATALGATGAPAPPGPAPAPGAPG